MRRGGWSLAALLWLTLALYALWAPHRIAWLEGSLCLADALRGQVCRRWR